MLLKENLYHFKIGGARVRGNASVWRALLPLTHVVLSGPTRRRPGETVSEHTVCLDIRGPGFRPMVLVDLPGIIQARCTKCYTLFARFLGEVWVYACVRI